MSLGDYLKQEVSRERKKMREMSFRDKIWYIGEYYKLHILVAAIALFLLYAVGFIFYQKTFTTQLTCMVINDRGSNAVDYETLQAGFAERMGYGKKDRLEFDTSLYLSMKSGTSEMDYATMAKITAMVASKDLDIMITDEEVIDHYSSNGGYLDLEEFLPADLWELVKDDAYYTKDEDGSVHPFAVNLENSQFHEITNCGLEPAYLGFVNNSKRTDTAVEFLRYLYEE